MEITVALSSHTVNELLAHEVQEHFRASFSSLISVTTISLTSYKLEFSQNEDSVLVQSEMLLMENEYDSSVIINIAKKPLHGNYSDYRQQRQALKDAYANTDWDSLSNHEKYIIAEFFVEIDPTKQISALGSVSELLRLAQVFDINSQYSRLQRREALRTQVLSGMNSKDALKILSQDKVKKVYDLYPEGIESRAEDVTVDGFVDYWNSTAGTIFENNGFSEDCISFSVSINPSLTIAYLVSRANDILVNGNY